MLSTSFVPSSELVLVTVVMFVVMAHALVVVVLVVVEVGSVSLSQAVVGAVVVVVVRLPLLSLVILVCILRRGAWAIIRSIWRCVRRRRFSSSAVSVQASHPYRTVGVMMP